MTTKMSKTQPEIVKDFLGCYKIEILVHVVKRIKREQIFKKFEIINVNHAKVGKLRKLGKHRKLRKVGKMRDESFDFAMSV